MKSFFIIILLMFLNCFFSFSQKGMSYTHFFKFNNHEEYLDYLDYCRKNTIDGEIWFYLCIKNKETKTDNFIVLSNQDINFTDLNVEDYKSFQNITDSKLILKFKDKKVNDSLFKIISGLSELKFFEKFISSNGVIINYENEVLLKAILLRLLRENYCISIDDVSGDLCLTKSKINFPH